LRRPTIEERPRPPLRRRAIAELPRRFLRRRAIAELGTAPAQRPTIAELGTTLVEEADDSGIATATTEIYTLRNTLSLHDALPISTSAVPSSAIVGL
jgi:hypothetical protein